MLHWDYEPRLGCGTIMGDRGEIFLQGEPASELDDLVEAAKTDDEVQSILETHYAV